MGFQLLQPIHQCLIHQNSLVQLQLVELGDLSHIDQLGQPVGWEENVRDEMRYRGASQMTRNQYKWKAAAKDTETNVDDPEVEKLRGTVGEPVAAGSM